MLQPKPAAPRQNVMARILPILRSCAFPSSNITKVGRLAGHHYGVAIARVFHPLQPARLQLSKISLNNQSFASPSCNSFQTRKLAVMERSQPFSNHARILANSESSQGFKQLREDGEREQRQLRGGLQDGSPPPSTTTPLTATASKLLTTLPHENIYTIPNILTFTRLLAAPAVGYAVLTAQPTLALALFAYAGVTDAVDGYLARRFNQTTVVGTVIDPMADKALMTIAVVTLSMQGIIPVWLAVVILGRDVALAISAIYFRYISLPPPKTFARYWDFSLPSAEVHPTEISKINTLLQLLLIGSAMALPVLRESLPELVALWNLSGVFEGWSYLVGATTVWSGLSYIGNKDAVKILTQEQIDEKMEERQKNVKAEK